MNEWRDKMKMYLRMKQQSNEGARTQQPSNEVAKRKKTDVIYYHVLCLNKNLLFVSYFKFVACVKPRFLVGSTLSVEISAKLIIGRKKFIRGKIYIPP